MSLSRYLEHANLDLKPNRWKEIEKEVALLRWENHQSLAMVVVYPTGGMNRDYAGYARTARRVLSNDQWTTRNLTPEEVLEMHAGVHFYIPK